MFALTDDKLALLGEVVLGDLEVERGRSLSYPAGDVVVRTVAGAEPAAEVAGLADWDTTQVSADTYSQQKSVTESNDQIHKGHISVSCATRGLHTQHDQPFGLLDALLIGLRITERGNVDLVRLVDLALGAVADEDGLASPLDDDLYRVSVHHSLRIIKLG
jgi:hypothetical protein